MCSVVSAVIILLAGSMVGCQAPPILPATLTSQVRAAISPTRLFEPIRTQFSTATPKSRPTFTSQQSATSTLTPTRMPDLVVKHDAYCYAGPGEVYGVVNTPIKGAVARAIGRGEAGYWVISIPIRSDIRCWIGSKFVEADRSAMLCLTFTPLPCRLGPPLQHHISHIAIYHKISFDIPPRVGIQTHFPTIPGIKFTF